MTNNRFVFTGLEELKAELRALPATLTGEATHLVEGAANGAGVAVRAAYGAHRFTGNLQDHVEVEQRPAGAFGVFFAVRVTARHADLFERGTEARHYITRNGVTKLTGKMPPANIFVPAMRKARRAMYDGLRGVLTRAGLQVSGDA